LSNTARIFSEILSIDAWRSQASSNAKEAKVHVELAFHHGRLGGDDFSIPFTFSIYLKRAVLSIQVSSPLKIDRDSIARGVPEKEVELTKLRNIRESIVTSGSGRLSINPAIFFAQMSGGVKSAKEITLEEQSKVIETVPPILIRPSPTGMRGEYRWELEPSYLPYLDGQPWDPVGSPRLSIQDLTEAGDEALVKVFVSCKLEDIEIKDLKLKDGCFDAKLSQAIYGDMNRAAAVQYIKHALRYASLEPGMLDNRFSSVLLADILAISG